MESKEVKSGVLFTIFTFVYFIFSIFVPFIAVFLILLILSSLSSFLCLVYRIYVYSLLKGCSRIWHAQSLIILLSQCHSQAKLFVKLIVIGCSNSSGCAIKPFNSCIWFIVKYVRN